MSIYFHLPSILVAFNPKKWYKYSEGYLMSYYYGWEKPQIRFGPSLTRMVKFLILINAGVFLLQIILRFSGLEKGFAHFFGLVPVLISRKSMLWQFFTYMFLHSVRFPLHILFNMFLLWMFGSDLEREWGGGQFLRYYFVTGVGAGIFYYLSAVRSGIPAIGASGAIFGVLVAFALTFPERMITVFLFFFLPVTMKAKHLILILGGIELLFAHLSSGNAGGIAHFAHLGGMLVGYIYLKGWRRIGYCAAIWRPRLAIKLIEKLSNLGARRTELRERSTNLGARQEEELEREVDIILDKISKEGMRSLTRREKKLLQKKAEK